MAAIPSFAAGSKEHLYMSSIAGFSSLDEAVQAMTPGRPPRSSAPKNEDGHVISKGRELNRISQTKYRQRLKVSSCVQRAMAGSPRDHVSEGWS